MKDRNMETYWKNKHKELEATMIAPPQKKLETIGLKKKNQPNQTRFK